MHANIDRNIDKGIKLTFLISRNVYLEIVSEEYMK